MIPSWAHDVKPEDITNATMLDLAELLGTENMLTLVESYSGMIIYVPKLDSRAGRICLGKQDIVPLRQRTSDLDEKTCR